MPAATRSPAWIPFILVPLLAGTLQAQTPGGLDDLPRLDTGKVRAANALWIENPLTARFNTSKRVVVADLAGPAEISMIHFALPQSEVGDPIVRLNRDLVLRIYWDGETDPSVNVPFVDFFCDPAGQRDSVNTAVLNKRRGYNAYFPMPFAKTARIELVYDGAQEPGEGLWRIMPCYSYVIYRERKELPADLGTFHAAWRQEALPLGTRDYLAVEAEGRGKFIGWNVTMRLPGRPGYPVDQNEKFYVDGEEKPSLEFQGIEDSFGFSWGFPAQESQFPLTGYAPFFQGASAYRWFLRDSISFEKSLRIGIGFGENEDPGFRREFSKAGNQLQLASTVYWYQTEPHRKQVDLPSAADRAPAPEQAFWPEHEVVPTAEELHQRGVRLQIRCGRPAGEVLLADPGYGLRTVTGASWNGWGLPVSYCRSGDRKVDLELDVPPGSEGTLRVFVIDPDHFMGGRKQTVCIAGEAFGPIEGFEAGRWVERALSKAETATGRVAIQAENLKPEGNAVVSIVEWVSAGK